MHGHDRPKRRQLMMSTQPLKQTRCESQLPLLLAAITMPQYQLASPSSVQHSTDTSGNNGEH